MKRGGFCIFSVQLCTRNGDTLRENRCAFEHPLASSGDGDACCPRPDGAAEVSESSSKDLRDSTYSTRVYWPYGRSPS